MGPICGLRAPKLAGSWENEVDGTAFLETPPVSRKDVESFLERMASSVGTEAGIDDRIVVTEGRLPFPLLAFPMFGFIQSALVVVDDKVVLVRPVSRGQGTVRLKSTRAGLQPTAWNFNRSIRVRMSGTTPEGKAKVVHLQIDGPIDCTRYRRAFGRGRRR